MLNPERTGADKVDELHNEHKLVSNCQKQMETGGADKGSKCINDEYNQSQDKQCGARRKLSLETFGQLQKRNGSGKEDLAPNCCLSTDPWEPSFTSVGHHCQRLATLIIIENRIVNQQATA